jgi:hypothetical protein
MPDSTDYVEIQLLTRSGMWLTLMRVSATSGTQYVEQYLSGLKRSYPTATLRAIHGTSVLDIK